MLRSFLPVVVLLAACGEPKQADASPPKPAPAAAAPTTAAATGDVATWNGGSLSAAGMEAELKGQLQSIEMKYLMDRYEKQSQYVDGKLTEAILTAEAKAGGYADINALMKVEVEAKVTPPTKDEVEAFYPTVARQLRGASLEEARPMLEGELLRRKQGQRYGEYVKEVKAKYGAKVLLPYPELPRVEIPITDADPMLGKATAPITVVQYAEYQCPYCGMAADTVDALLKEYPDQVRVIFKDFPLNFHERAMPAAVAAHCAGEQGKYWELNRLMLKNQQALQDTDLDGYAKQIGLDVDSWMACRGSGKYEPVISAGVTDAQKLGVQATPTFFVNGIMLSGAQPIDAFKPIIEKELAAK